MQNVSKTKESTPTTTNEQELTSLVLIRLELDDIDFKNNYTCSDITKNEDQFLLSFNLNKSSVISSQEQLRKSASIASFEFVSKSSLKEQNPLSNLGLDSYSEKFGSKEKTLNSFIGKRLSKLICIETYYVHAKTPIMNSTKDHEVEREEKEEEIINKTSIINSQSLSNNAMTMQTALETAYNDWNKKKSTPETQVNEAVKSKDTEPNANKDVNEAKRSTLTGLADTEFQLLANEDKIRPVATVTKKADDSLVPISKSNSDVTEIPYYYGNPTIDIVKGLLHIYKDSNFTTMNDRSNKSNKDDNSVPIVPRSEMLCMIGIPASITCNELLEFIRPGCENLVYIRIIRDTYPNRYMAILKFTNEKEADLFYSYFNNREFNSIEENICHLAFVERLEAINTSKGGSLPIDGFTELPTCYICLERMDESLNGVITILCNHSFHTACLSKWGDTCCPVCRFSQTPEYSVDNTCSECGSHENLWICLICGNVGCGRYVSAHAYSHFKLTQHTYSMELGNNRVWDYAADNYVHRLIQNKTDGKLVQFDEGGREVHQDEKVDSITLEYTYLLTSQLESQRLFFEERIVKLEEKSRSQLADLEAKSVKIDNENVKLKENLTQVTKEKNNLERKCTTLSSKLTKLQSELDEEKEMNKCLLSNQEAYQKKLSSLEDNLEKSNKKKEEEISDLQSQLRDIMFYMDAQSKLSGSKDVTQDELQDSHMIIQQEETSGATASAGKTSRRKKKN